MIRVLVVDDSLVLRKWVVEVLEDTGGFDVIGESTNGQQAIQMADQLRPDVIVMDMAMPIVDGVNATRHIMARFPHLAL